MMDGTSKPWSEHIAIKGYAFLKNAHRGAGVSDEATERVGREGAVAERALC